MCELAGDCTDSATPAADAPAAHGGARSSATRGFTFKRTAPDPKLAAGTGASPMPAPMASAAPTAPRPQRTMSADLRLDFASASAELNPASRVRLGKLASALGNPRLATKRIRIEGHTDASGNPVTNRMLSQKRAQAAADYLVASGVARSRIEVIGYGSAQPLPNVAASDPMNRRVMATLLN